MFQGVFRLGCIGAGGGKEGGVERRSWRVRKEEDEVQKRGVKKTSAPLYIFFFY